MSCLASCPDGSGLLAAGAYSGSAALYDQHTLELLFVLQGHTGGLTQARPAACSFWPAHCQSSMHGASSLRTRLSCAPRLC